MAQAVIKGGYYPSWASNLPHSSINTDHFTHIYYAFVNPNKVTFKFEIDQTTDRKLQSFTSVIHRENNVKYYRQPVKILFSVGGYDDELSAGFARMASNLSSRSDFIESCMRVAREYGFDGIDVDWEYPRSSVEMTNFGELLDQFRFAIQHEAGVTNRPPLLLTAAVYYSARKDSVAYPADAMSKNLDWVNIMTYDYHGSWDIRRTGAHAALFDPNGTKSTSYGLQSWIQAGVPKSKLIMGLPLYGKTWELRGPGTIFPIGASAVGVGQQGKNGVLTYAEVVSFNRKSYVTVEHDFKTCSDYSYGGTEWVGYDDTATVAEKIRYAQGLGLRGYFLWAISYDYEWRISKTASLSWSQ